MKCLSLGIIILYILTVTLIKGYTANRPDFSVMFAQSQIQSLIYKLNVRCRVSASQINTSADRMLQRSEFN